MKRRIQNAVDALKAHLTLYLLKICARKPAVLLDGAAYLSGDDYQPKKHWVNLSWNDVYGYGADTNGETVRATTPRGGDPMTQRQAMEVAISLVSAAIWAEKHGGKADHEEA